MMNFIIRGYGIIAKVLNNSLLACIMLVFMFLLGGCNESPEYKTSRQDRNQAHIVSSKSVVIIWSVAGKEAAVQTVLAYPLNARINGWLENVSIIVSGPPVKLIAEDAEIRKIMEQMSEAGISVIIDKSSVDFYHVEEKLESLNAEIIHPGKLLTRFIDADATILPF